MRLTSLNAFPLFPDWVFTGNLSLEKTMLDSAVAESERVAIERTNFGYRSKLNSIGPVGNNLLKLIGNMFINESGAHFNMNEELQSRINVCAAQYIGIAPEMKTDIQVKQQRWYRAIMKLDGDAISSNLRLSMFNEKRFTTPTGVQPWEHMIELQPGNVVFIPAHVPWDLTVNQSKHNCTFYTLEFHVVPPKN